MKKKIQKHLNKNEGKKRHVQYRIIDRIFQGTR